ncbi:ABC transporter permease [Virgibacillus oceani]
MFDSHAFYKKRISEHLKETSRYLRYIFNGHLMIAMFFFIAVLAYYYQQALADLPENFPASIIIGGAFGLIASYSPVRTLLREPDLVFLIAAESKMNAYFRNGLIYSFLIQLYVVFLIAAALGPLYFATFPERTGNVYLLTIAVLLIFKVGNLVANWWMLKVRDPWIRQVDMAVRVVLNVAVFYFMVNGNMLLAGIATVLFAIVFLYNYSISRKQAGIHWSLLVEKDNMRMQAFYRLANMFADVPHLKTPIKKRAWLVSLFSNLPFLKKHTYDYLYRITFIRSGDYLGMYFRLILIGLIAIFYVPNVILKVLLGVLFLYLSSFQMMSLYKHHRTIMWLDLYPVDLTIRQKSLINLLFQLTLIQAVIFSILFLVMQLYVAFAVMLVAGVIFNYLFINGYVKRKLV